MSLAVACVLSLFVWLFLIQQAAICPMDWLIFSHARYPQTGSVSEMHKRAIKQVVYVYLATTHLMVLGGFTCKGEYNGGDLAYGSAWLGARHSSFTS